MPSEAVDLLIAERCTHMAGATPFLEQILAAARRRGTRLPDLKVFICGGASVSPSLIRSAADYFEHAIVTPGVRLDRGSGHHRRLHPDDRRPGRRHRRPSRHRDHPAGPHPAARTAPVRSVPAVRRCCVGYLHPEDDADAFDADGYFRTGDLGRLLDDDYLVVTGRAKDIIIRNGENIAPKEVEDMLIGHPGITEVADRRPSRSAHRRAGLRGRSSAPHRPARRSADLREFLAATGRGDVQESRTGGRLGRPAQERRGQDSQTSDPSKVG